MKFKETQPRTITKTLIYKVLTFVDLFVLTLLWGGSLGQAMTLGVLAVTLGMLIYYIYERVWVYIGWQRDDTGFESVSRSITKAIIYRIVIYIVVMIQAMFILSGSNASAMGFSLAQTVTNFLLYYFTDRIFNKISWGKVLVADEE